MIREVILWGLFLESLIEIESYYESQFLDNVNIRRAVFKSSYCIEAVQIFSFCPSKQALSC